MESDDTLRESGITLIALIITVIVMLILAFVTVSSINGFGLFSKVNQAKNMYENSHEEDEINNITDALDNYLHQGTSTEGTTTENASISSYDDLTIVKGNKATPKLEYSGGATKTTYSSSDINIATIDNAGEVTANEVGTATMTVTMTNSDDTTVTATCTVTVQAAVAQVGTGATAVYYASLQSAIDAVPTTNAETQVFLLTDTTETITVKANKNVDLDLKDKTLTGVSNSAVNINSSGTLTLLNGTILVTGGGSQNSAIQNSGTFAMKGGMISVTGVTDTYNWGVSGNSGTFTMSGGTISVTGGSKYNYGVASNSGTVTMTGGTISVTAGSMDNYGVNTSGPFTMQGGMILATGEGSTNNYGISCGTGASFTMTEGTISVTGGGSTSTGVYTSGPFIMQEGTISVEGACTNSYGVSTQDTFTMSGGKISVTGGSSNNRGVNTSMSKTYTMTGGTIAVTGIGSSYNYGVATDKLFTISNGTISATGVGSSYNYATYGPVLLYNCSITGSIVAPTNTPFSVNITTTPGAGYKIEYYPGGAPSSIVTAVQFQTWCDADQAGTTYNYSATKQTTAYGTAWVCTVDKSNQQNKTGAYTTDIYATISGTTSMVMDISGIINI
ncbi:MAG: Ig-like domain-containing protein [Oscillospiraceae bacterium]|nr:Ig-like domain-containing protein [Oscillospiraceae bacterium]